LTVLHPESLRDNPASVPSRRTCARPA